MVTPVKRRLADHVDARRHGAGGASVDVRVDAEGRVRVRLLVGGGGRAATAEQVSVVVAPELLAEQVERERVDARVDERQAEAGDLEDVPEHVVDALVETEPQDVDVSRQPARDEHDDEGKHDLGDTLPRLQLLARLRSVGDLGR